MFSRFMLTLPTFIGQFFKFALIVAVIGAASHYVGELIPRKSFNYLEPPYAAYRWEQNGMFYTRFKIQFWKDKLPDMSQHVKRMFRKKISVFRDYEYLEELILETCVAEFVHWMLVFLSPVFLVLMEGLAGRISAALYAIGNLPFVMIQRYNRPRLVNLMERQKRQSLVESLQRFEVRALDS
jgi:glycosyl-4,4'-diaponeurosporenoate acyltransferase